MRKLIVGLGVLCVGAGGGSAPDWTSFDVRLDAPPERVRVAPLDGDAFPDIVYVTGYFKMHQPATLGVLRNADAGMKFEPHWEQGLVTFYGPHGVPLDVGDLDGDGFVDLAMANHEGEGSIILRFGDGSGTFAETQHLLEYGDFMSDVRVADDDGDGDLDLIATTRDAGQFWYLDRFPGLGDGSFAPFEYTPVAFDVYHNYLIVNPGRFTSLQEPEYLLNGDRAGRYVTLEPTHEWFSNEQHPGCAVADFNDDGFDDFALSVPAMDHIRVFLSTGELPLPEPQRYAAQAFPTGLATCDVDLDGDLDLVVCNLESDSVSLLHNRGDGSFRQGAVLPTGNGPSSVAAADLDLDGDPDLVVGNRRDASLTILLNPLR